MVEIVIAALGHIPGLDPDAHHEEILYRTDVRPVEKNGRTYLHTTADMVQVSYIDVHQTGSGLNGFQNIGERIEEQEHLPPIVILKGTLKIGDTNNPEGEVRGNNHAHYPGSGFIRADIIIDDKNGVSLDKGDPTFHDLTVDKPVINPGKDDRHNYFPERYSAATLMCCLP